MPSISITKTYADGQTLFSSDLDVIRDDIETFFNTTKIDSSNIQDSGISTQKIVDGAITNSKLASNAVTNVKIASTTIEKAKLSLALQSYLYTAGDIKAFHSYNGELDPGQGWMLCDGRQITEANYDAEHGAGSWASYIDGVINSNLENKYLPDMDNKFLVGKDTTTQDGSVAMTFEGNASHQVNIQHSHVVDSHNHRWYTNDGTNGQTFDTGGNVFGLATGAPGSGLTVGAGGLFGQFHTNNQSPGTSSAGSTTQDVKPESLAVQMYMRII